MKKEREFATWFILQHGPRPLFIPKTPGDWYDKGQWRWDQLYTASLWAYREGIRQGIMQDPARPAGNVAHSPRRATRRT